MHQALGVLCALLLHFAINSSIPRDSLEVGESKQYFNQCTSQISCLPIRHCSIVVAKLLHMSHFLN